MISMTSPKVVLKTQFHLALNNKKISDKMINNINGMFDYYSNPIKQAENMFDYYDGTLKNNKFNLVLEDGNYATKKEIDKRKKDYQKYLKKSNLWKGIVSFNNDYIDTNISLEDLEKKMINEILPRFFKECGFKNTSNMSYQVALHTDTDNYHFHFSFIEKKPNYVTKQNKLSYRTKGQLSQREMNYLKDQVILSVERGNYYTNLLTKTNKDIDYLKSYFNPKDNNFTLKNKKDIFLEEKIFRLGDLVSKYQGADNYNKVKYNSIRNNEIKKLTNEIKEYLFNDKNSDLRVYKGIIDKDLKKLNKYYVELNKSNNIENYHNKDLLDNKERYLDNYVLNAIINYAKDRKLDSSNQKDKIDVNDLIKSSACLAWRKHSFSNKKVMRKVILHDYFTGSTNKAKFSAKYEMENSLKKISREMDKASEQFHQLFEQEKEKRKDDDYSL